LKKMTCLFSLRKKGKKQRSDQPCMPKRLEQINQVVKKQVSQILLKEMDFPSDILVTVTRVETTSNKRESKVYVGVIPEEKKEKVFQSLRKKVFFIQQEINKNLRMRPVPKIRFVEEEQTKKAARIEEILEQLKKREK